MSLQFIDIKDSKVKFVDEKEDPKKKIEALELLNDVLLETIVDMKVTYNAVPCQLHEEYPMLVDELIEERAGNNE